MIRHNESGIVVTWKPGAAPERLEIYTSIKAFTDQNPEFNYNTVARSKTWRENSTYENARVKLVKAPVIKPVSKN